MQYILGIIALVITLLILSAAGVIHEKVTEPSHSPLTGNVCVKHHGTKLYIESHARQMFGDGYVYKVLTPTGDTTTVTSDKVEACK